MTFSRDESIDKQVKTPLTRKALREEVGQSKKEGGITENLKSLKDTISEEGLGAPLAILAGLALLKYLENPKKTEKMTSEESETIESQDFKKDDYCSEMNEGYGLGFLIDEDIDLDKEIKLAESRGLKGVAGDVDQTLATVESTEGLEFLREGATDSQGTKYFTMPILLQKALRLVNDPRAIAEITYNWNIHCEKDRVGKKQCARTVGNILGLGGREGEQHRYFNVTTRLAPALIAGNLQRTGKTGIVFGMENYRKGDVIIYKGGDHPDAYGHGRLAHAGVVREVLDIDGEKYVAVQHDGKKLFVDLVPIDSKSTKWKDLKEKLDNPDTRKEMLKKYPKLVSIYEFRSGHEDCVRVRDAKSRDASKGQGGNIAFAIRTDTLVAPSTSGTAVA